MITRVDPAGPAFGAQLRPRMVIVEINRRPLRSVSEYEKIVSSAKPGDVLALYIYDSSSAQRLLVPLTVER